MRKLLSFLLHPVVATIFGGLMGGSFSHLGRKTGIEELEIVAYVFYIYPMLILFYWMVVVAISKIKSLKENLVYKRNKGTLTGQLKDSKGVPCKFFSVRVVNSDGSVGINYSGRYMNMTNKNGEFTIHRLYNGDYKVIFYSGSQVAEVPFTISDDMPVVRLDYSFK